MVTDWSHSAHKKNAQNPFRRAERSRALSSEMCHAQTKNSFIKENALRRTLLKTGGIGKSRNTFSGRQLVWLLVLVKLWKLGTADHCCLRADGRVEAGICCNDSAWSMSLKTAPLTPCSNQLGRNQLHRMVRAHSIRSGPCYAG